LTFGRLRPDKLRASGLTESLFWDASLGVMIEACFSRGGASGNRVIQPQLVEISAVFSGAWGWLAALHGKGVDGAIPSSYVTLNLFQGLSHNRGKQRLWKDGC
jgi:hypothetical protein